MISDRALKITHALINGETRAAQGIIYDIGVERVGQIFSRTLSICNRENAKKYRSELRGTPSLHQARREKVFWLAEIAKLAGKN